MKKHPFAIVAQEGFLGAIVGLCGGLVLAILIYSILVLSGFVTHSGGMRNQVPVQFVLLLGMGWGSVLGGIFGGITALKK